jgi:hypothetical protein
MNATARQNGPSALEPQSLASQLTRSDAVAEWQHAGLPSCPVCLEPLLPDIKMCPRCLNKVGDKDGDQPTVREVSASSASNKTSAGAVYTIESPVRCPECETEIRTFRVLRVVRTQASFTSTLPRKGYVIVCPACERMLSAELSGLV